MKIKTARRIARLTQKQLAKMIGVDHSLISHIESGRRALGTVAYETVVRMARVFNVDPHDIAPVADFVPPVDAATESAADRRRRVERRRSADRRRSHGSSVSEASVAR